MVRTIVCVCLLLLQISLKSLQQKIIPTECARNPVSTQNTPNSWNIHHKIATIALADPWNKAPHTF